MVYLVNNKNALFDEKEARLIFRRNERYLNSPFSYHELKHSDWFFAVVSDKGETIGVCYVLCENLNGKEVPFYSGAFKRKHHKEVIKAHKILLNIIFESYERAYTFTPHLHARIFNKKAGMKQDPDNDGVFYLDKKDFYKDI
ncbi:MAG: hypothetical protein BWY78_01441 [Alphaproteobacteria bacterium ADurb.Bin438]|nr:MAG: hypothetical protein BWY78_01441 [Alphaproteobacteria bacterium ADurb.Bin438]